MTRLKAAASLGAQTHSIMSVSGGISFSGSRSRGVQQLGANGDSPCLRLIKSVDTHDREDTG